MVVSEPTRHSSPATLGAFMKQQLNVEPSQSVQAPEAGGRHALHQLPGCSKPLAPSAGVTTKHLHLTGGWEHHVKP